MDTLVTIIVLIVLLILMALGAYIGYRGAKEYSKKLKKAADDCKESYIALNRTIDKLIEYKSKQ